jgi:hypothetical protein
VHQEALADLRVLLVEIIILGRQAEAALGGVERVDVALLLVSANADGEEAADPMAATCARSVATGWMPAALMVAVSMAEAKKSPTFCSTEPGSWDLAAAVSRMARSAAWLYWSSWPKAPQRDLSAGSGLSCDHLPQA